MALFGRCCGWWIRHCGQIRFAPWWRSFFLAGRVAIARSLQQRLNEDRQEPAPFWIVLVKDLLQTAIWAIAFCGNKIEWRGRKMRLRRDGNMEPILS